tara:strand:- start:218 stop:646 length:429 start_codon:yes stop_codon:yes gene_type:complete
MVMLCLYYNEKWHTYCHKKISTDEERLERYREYGVNSHQMSVGISVNEAIRSNKPWYQGCFTISSDTFKNMPREVLVNIFTDMKKKLSKCLIDGKERFEGETYVTTLKKIDDRMGDIVIYLQEKGFKNVSYEFKKWDGGIFD